jgi:hypothetical protein
MNSSSQPTDFRSLTFVFPILLKYSMLIKLLYWFLVLIIINWFSQFITIYINLQPEILSITINNSFQPTIINSNLILIFSFILFMFENSVVIILLNQNFSCSNYYNHSKAFNNLTQLVCFVFTAIIINHLYFCLTGAILFALCFCYLFLFVNFMIPIILSKLLTIHLSQLLILLFNRLHCVFNSGVSVIFQYLIFFVDIRSFILIMIE